MSVSPKALKTLLETYNFSDLYEYPNVGINKKGEAEEFSYSGNFFLRHRNAKLLFTKPAQDEYDKCSADFFYFVENHINIETIDHGVIKFKLRDWQIEAIETLQEMPKLILNVARQSGKSTIIIAYIVWLLVFNKDMKFGIVANRSELVSELVGMAKTMYMLLPPYLQHNIIKWNTRSIELANGCRLVSAVASGSALRGQTLSFLLCVDGEKSVRVRDKHNLREKTIKLEELYKELSDDAV